MQSKFANSRLLFPSGEQKYFIEQIINCSSKEMADVVGVSERTVRDWKREKYKISKMAILKLCARYKLSLPQNMEVLINNWKKSRIELCSKGAKERYKIYGNFSTPEGRRLGGHNALQILRKRGLVAWCSKPYKYPKRSIELAEFVGIMLGDGGITTNQSTITLNTIADKQYIKFVCKLGKKLFGQQPKVAPRNDCQATNLRYSGINLINYLQKIGLKTGDKVKQQVDIPCGLGNH